MGRKQVRRGILVLMCLLLVAVFTASCGKNDNQGGQKNAEKVVLRLVLGQPSGDEVTVADEEMAKKFNERAASYGYEMKIHPGGQLAQVPEFLDAVRTGAVEMMNSSTPIFAGADPRLSASQLPYLFENRQAVKAAQKDLGVLYDELLQEKFNQKVIAHWYTGSLNIFTNKKEIKSFDDLKGVLIGTTEPMSADIATNLKATAISVPWTDFYTSLDKGVIDGLIFVTNGVIANKMTDKLKYFLDEDLAIGHNVYSINLDVWKAMPKEVQDILTEEVTRRAETGTDHFIAQHDEYIKILKDSGLTVNVLSEEEKKLFKESCIKYTKEHIAALGDFGKKLQEIADKANAQSK